MLESGESLRNRQGEQIKRDERVPEARKMIEVKMTRGRCTCISMLERILYQMKRQKRQS